ncbi:tetratricopeptide repeat protein [Flagellimonas sp.]|uniref:tetratricopeptide repeat protein n=1 Tax=Flagellimonas sp. TaxID=2058762 RepID=UPI003F4A7946
MGFNISFIRPTLIFLFIVSLSSAQTRQLDSLKSLISTADDTTQVNLLRQMGILSRFEDKEKALTYGAQSLNRAREIGFVKGEIESLYHLGLTNGMTGSYVESLDYLNQCLALAKKQEDYKFMKMAYSSLGIVHKRIGDYPKSKDYYLKSLKLVDSLDLPFDNSITYINLGILYDLMDQQEDAIKSYKMVLEVYKGPDKAGRENSVLANLALIDMDNQDYDAALTKYLKVKEYHEKQNNKIRLCTNYSNLGDCYMKLEEWELSYQYLQKALELAEELSVQRMIPVINYNLANLMWLQKRYSEAKQYSNMNLRSLPDYGAYQHKADAHEKAHDIYKSTGEYNKAIYHLNQVRVYEDSILNEAKVKEIQNLQIQHDVFLKDKELKENELQLALLNTRVSQNNKRLVYLLIITSLLLLSAALFYFLYLGKKQSNQVFQEKNKLISEQNGVIEKMNVELEKRMLRAQMNPHFIFNSLNSIQHLIINSKDRTTALKYLTKFSKLLRQVLESSVNVSLALKEEIELLKIYLELESLRFDNAFSYNIVVDDILDIEEHEIPLLLVQPYVENAIVHGLMPKKGPKELSITFNDVDGYIQCIIEDNGVGINAPSEKAKNKRPSRGMSITAKRIKALRKVSNEQLVTIENLCEIGKTGTKVTILVPKQGLTENTTYEQKEVV